MAETRRDLLRKGGQLTAAGVVVSTAGCLRQIPVIGPMIAGPRLPPKKWVGAPGVVSDGDHESFNHVNYEEILNNESELDSDTAESLTEMEGSAWEAAGLSTEDAVVGLDWGGVSIVQGNLNKNDAISALEGEDFSEETTKNDFTILTGDDDSEYPRRGAGVTGNRIIEGYGTDDKDPDEVVATAIDVGNGNADRYADENEDFQTLLNKTGIGTITVGSTGEEVEETTAEAGQFEGNVASGARYDINGEDTAFKAVYIFDTSDDVNTGDIEDYVSELESAEDGILSQTRGEVTVNQDGRAGIIEATIPTNEL